MITIKEVYDQLPKEDLGTERALFISYGGDHEIGREFYLVGVCRDSEYPYVAKFGNVYNSFTGHHEVKWIGNKPKTKKIYAYLVGWENSDFGGMIYNVNRAEKHVGERHNYFIKWLPEDKYPPIEVEVGE